MNLSKIAPWVAGVGLVGLAVYQLTQGDVAGMVASLTLAAADFGLKLKLPAQAPAPPPEKPS